MKQREKINCKQRNRREEGIVRIKRTEEMQNAFEKE